MDEKLIDALQKLTDTVLKLRQRMDSADQTISQLRKEFDALKQQIAKAKVDPEDEPISQSSDFKEQLRRLRTALGKVPREIKIWDNGVDCIPVAILINGRGKTDRVQFPDGHTDTVPHEQLKPYGGTP